MKKHKSVVSILLAIMMVFTFMPTLAFADTVHEGGHHWDEGKTVKAASTCGDYMLTEYKCEGEEAGGDWVLDDEDDEWYAVNTDHLDCGASYTDITVKEHNFGTEAKPNFKNVPIDEFLAQVAKQEPGMWDDTAEELFKGAFCYVFVPVCKDCGAYDLHNELAPWRPMVHEEVADTKACAETMKCKICGKTVPHRCTTAGHNPGNHDYDAEKFKGTYCSSVDLTGEGHETDGGFTVWEKTCKVCGDVHTETRPNVVGSDGEPANILHDGLGTAVTPKAGEEKYYVLYEGKYYAPTEIVKGSEPKCEEEGVGALICSTCKKEIGRCAVKAKGHTVATQVKEATCLTAGETVKICTEPGCGKITERVPGAAALGHKFKVSVLAAPSCFADGITLVECETCKKLALVSDANTTTDATSKKIYFTGFPNEPALAADKRVEVADWKMGDHDYGKYEDITEASCNNGVFQARKCSKCGTYDVHHYAETGQPKGHNFVTTTQEPTCGAEGFTYELCTVCGDVGEWKAFGKPLVAYGTKCTFDKWEVETAATPFKEGTKKLVCSVCGDDGHYVISDGVVKETAVTRTVIAKTKIAAPKVKSLKKKAKVTVKAVPGAVKYQILVNGKVSKTVKKAGTFTVKKAIKAGKKNKFQIRAINADGVKATSKAKSVKIKKK